MINPYEFKVSPTTIGRIAKDLKIKNKTQKPKEKLTIFQKENIVTFCKNLLKSSLYLNLVQKSSPPTQKIERISLIQIE